VTHKNDPVDYQRKSALEQIKLQMELWWVPGNAEKIVPIAEQAYKIKTFNAKNYINLMVAVKENGMKCRP
jgi:hypothetical protein